MADINIGSDALLTTALANNDRVAITRAATGQKIASMNVMDFFNKYAEMMSIDLSIIGRQSIPDLYGYRSNGEKAKTYSNTIRMTMPSSGDATLLQLANSRAVLCHVFGDTTNAYGFPLNIQHIDVISNSGGTVVYSLREGTIGPGQEFIITLIYFSF